jgi:hypothetical protein
MENVETQIWKDLLSIFSEEELIRFRRRAARAGKSLLKRLIETEIDKRGTG